LEQVHWLGTSMGGAIGLKAAAGSLRGRIRRLVLNDVGPQLADAAIQRCWRRPKIDPLTAIVPIQI
jgi:pimeloyl-ACP methyl ester carboxylesterase